MAGFVRVAPTPEMSHGFHYFSPEKQIDWHRGSAVGLTVRRPVGLVASIDALELRVHSSGARSLGVPRSLSSCTAECFPSPRTTSSALTIARITT